MKCHIEGCVRESMYKGKVLCQMHYFRIMRNGTTEKLTCHKVNGVVVREKVFRKDGYVLVFERDHPLANKSGYVFEHRHVMWPVLGPICPPCEICGKLITWKTCHIDHIDRNRSNNSRENLRPLCSRCNTWRDYPDQCDLEKNHKITFDGVSKTPAEWARDCRVKVAGRTIILRLERGMSDEDALFSPKKTHNGNPKSDKRPRKTQNKHERKNSVAITIEGITLSASEWSREAGVSVSEASIINRFRSGLGCIESVFAPAKEKTVSDKDLQAIKKHYRALVREMRKQM